MIIYLADIACLDITGTPTATTLYYSSNIPVTVGNTYSPKIITPAVLGQSISIDSSIGGAISTSVGELTLVNALRDLDFLETNYIFEGFTLTLKVYDTETLVSTTILVQKIERLVFEWDRISIRLSNETSSLDKALQTIKYLGNNVLPLGSEGITDLVDKSKPLVFGRLANFEPVLVNSSALVYQISSSRVDLIVNAFTDGAYLSRDTATYASVDAMITAPYPAAGYFSQFTSSTGTFIKLGLKPGKLTCAVYERFTPLDNTTAAIIKRVLQYAGYSSANWIETDFQYIDSVNAESQGVVVGEGESVASILTALCQSIGVWWGFDGNNKFRLFYFGNFGGTNLANLYYSEGKTSPYGITSFELDKASYNGKYAPVKQVKLAYDKNWAVIDKASIAGVVTPEKVNWFSNEYRYRTDYAIGFNYPTWAELNYTTLLNSTSAYPEAVRVLALTSVKRYVITLTASLSMAILKTLVPCGLVTVFIPRYGMTAGKQFLITSVEVDYKLQTANLTLWG